MLPLDITNAIKHYHAPASCEQTKLKSDRPDLFIQGTVLILHIVLYTSRHLLQEADVLKGG